MAAFNGEIEVDLPQSRVWTFIRDIDNWAHLGGLAGGYIAARAISRSSPTISSGNCGGRPASGAGWSSST